MRSLALALIATASALAGDAGRDAFVEAMKKAIGEAGVQGPMQYDASEFSLTMKDGAVLFLERAWADYRGASDAEKPGVLARYARIVRERTAPTPDWKKARDTLLPILRTRHEFTMALRDGTVVRLPHVAFAQRFAIGLGQDRPDSIVRVGPETLKDWGVSFDTAFDRARANLRKLTTEFVASGDGVYAVKATDEYVVSRLLFTDRIARLDVKGDPVAFLPTRLMLIITGSENEAGLVAGTRVLIEQREDPRALNGVVLRLDRRKGTWHPFLPKKTSKAYHALVQLDLLAARHDFERQKAAIEREEKGVFAASFLVVKSPAGQYMSVCTWTEGVDSLLPKAGLVSFVSLKKGDDMLLVPWDDAARICADLLEKHKRYADRYRTKGYPDAAQAEKLKAVALR